MPRPNYRHNQQEKKSNPFLESVKQLLASKERGEKENQENDGEQSASDYFQTSVNYDEIEDGFIKTKASDFAYDITDDGEDYQEQQRDTEEKEQRQGVMLSTSACITAFVTVIILIGFAFLFGLIIGKGMAPTAKKEEPVPLIAELQKEEKPAEVLPKEELNFMTELKKEHEKKTPEQLEAEALEKAEKARQEALQKEEASQQALAGQKQMEEAKKKEAELLALANQKYDFDIRLAAFRSEEQADNLRVKLESDGFRTKKNIGKDAKGNWYYIHVLLIGTEERLKESRERFKKFGIRDTIIESKVPVK